jgi:hypothetical protein
VGATLLLRHVPTPGWFALAAALLITFTCWRVFGVRHSIVPPAPQPSEVDDGTGMPRYGTRRWARMMYHNGVISMEELVRFYHDNPE